MLKYSVKRRDICISKKNIIKSKQAVVIRKDRLQKSTTALKNKVLQ